MPLPGIFAAGVHVRDHRAAHDVADQRQVVAGGEHDEPRLDQRPGALAENADLDQRLVEQLAEEVAAERAADTLSIDSSAWPASSEAPSRFSVSSSSLPVVMTGHGKPVAIAAASWVR